MHLNLYHYYYLALFELYATFQIVKRARYLYRVSAVKEWFFNFK